LTSYRKYTAKTINPLDLLPFVTITQLTIVFLHCRRLFAIDNISFDERWLSNSA